ncbi:teichoic acid ABC transporter permease [Planococcus salinarum]|uniref:Transport permease protein n=1 Tax=Planococcus salinarum TaxID=622695 RepID=A0ABX3CWC3_9BACL|nr:ABC transporter permease [Planococcus salinarum]OHX49751.1 teichoic acid ABC transporter permease [Planococcus salinarum]TAA72778.1 ABC transporter permease [Planococcus salinarum]
MKSAFKILKEQIQYFYLVRRLSIYELRSLVSGNYLGMAWEIINPVIQISIYWFVFGYGIREREPVGDVPYLQWMFAGILAWFFITQAVLKGSKSIYSKIKMLAKMNFPMSVIPSYVIFSQFYPHLILLGLGTLFLQFIGYPLSIYILQLPLYIIGLLAFLFSLTLITSTLATIIRDVQMLLQSIMRMLLYLSPILWPPSLLPDEWQLALKLNPFYYIIEGYRHSLLGQGWYFIENPLYTFYFCGVVLVTFIIGAYLHVKFRSQFIDFL